jgi:hypothetical protein
MTDPHDLGFAGLLAEGLSPADAWQAIRDDLAAEPAALAVIAELDRDEEGRAALAWSRQQWAAHGLAPPWDGLEPGGKT